MEMMLLLRAEYSCILMFVFFFFKLLCGADGVIGEGGPHISNLNLLMPPLASNPVHYRLQASGGCFTWSWDHHDVLSLDAEFNRTSGCSTSAIITSIAPYSGRRATSVHARDRLTGYVLRCEVFVDKMSRIQIFHHSVKLDLDGFATLRVRGFDSEENIFSTLVGLKFAWHFSPHLATGDMFQHVLTHVPLKDSPLYNCDCNEIDTQVELEKNGFGSDLYVVQGVRAGQEVVTATLKEPDMDHLVDVITLTVAEPIYIEPTSPLYIIPGTKLQYILRTVRHNVFSDVQLPSLHYEWFVTNSSVATIDHNRGLLHGKGLGVTMVVVQDNRVPNHQQISTVHVVIPSVLRLYLSPLSAKGVGPRAPISTVSYISSSDTLWHLVEGREYVVQVLAFSEESAMHPLYLTKDNELELFFQNLPFWDANPIPEDVASEQGWKNASLVHALAEGDGTLSAVLVLENTKDANYDGLAFHTKQLFRVDQSVKVCSPVEIILAFDYDGSRSLILPWVPGTSQVYHLRARSGCGGEAMNYLWTSSDPSVAIVSTQGVVQSQGPGKTFIQAASFDNPLNVDEVIVEVELPWLIKPLEGLTVEDAVGSNFLVAITLLTASGKYFSACDAFNDGIVNWRISEGDGSFLLMKSEDSESLQNFLEGVSNLRPTFPVQTGSIVCAAAQFLAVSSGRATVTAKLNINDKLGSFNASDARRILKVSWSIFAYPPLSLEQAGDGKAIGPYDCDDGLQGAPSDGRNLCGKDLKEVFLVVGSSMKVILHGGPERWRQGVDFINYCEVLPVNDAVGAKDGMLVVRDKEGGGRIYLLICKDSGNFTLLFHRGNLVMEDNFAHVVAIAALHLVCDVPASVSLLIDEFESTLIAVKAASQLQWDKTRTRFDPLTIVNSHTITVSAVALYISDQPFTNFSSLFFRWSLESCNDLAIWEGGDSNEDVQSGSWQKRLVLGNATGECTLIVTIEKLKQSILSPSTLGRLNEIIKHKQPSLTDGAKLQLVHMLRLEPKESVLFVHPEAKAVFAVVGGSSELDSHTNNSNVAVVIQLPSAKNGFNLKVAARGLGVAEVLVRDVGIMNPVSTSALVTVADVAWVRVLLREDASIQLYSEVLVQIQAGDNRGRVFHSSQFQLMNVQVHLHDEALELVRDQSIAGPLSENISGNNFTIRGANVGLTSFHVSARKHSGEELRSDICRVSVYAPLSIHPSRLVLAPGAQYLITTIGGPKAGFSVQFISSNDKIATIGSVSGSVLAKNLGNTTVFALAYDVSGDLMTKCSVQVHVRVPTSMYLDVRSGRLSVGQEMSIFPTASSDMDLFSFFDVCTSYRWSIADEQVLGFHGVKLGTSRSMLTITNIEDGTYTESYPHGIINNKVEHASNSDFSARVFGRSAGRTTVTVSFMCNFYNAGKTPVPTKYKAFNNIWVVPNPPLAFGLCATWILPVNYTSSGLLPQRTDDLSSARLSAGSVDSVMYSLLHDSSSNSGIAILEGGRIKTSENIELTCVLARDRNTGRSEIATCIKVAEVAQMTVGVEKLPYHVVELSVNTQEHLAVNLRDELGIPFFEVGKQSMQQLVVDTNRADVVLVKITDIQYLDASANISISVQAIRQGTALIRVCYKGNRLISDFILIHIGAYVSPQNPVVHLGSYINFSVISKGELGSWSSTNPNIVDIDSLTGKALTVGEGVATVSFSGTRMVTYTSVTVIKVALAIIEAPSGVKVLTNVPIPEHGYKFRVKFSDSQGGDVGIVGNHHVVPYECLVQPSFVGKMVPWHESEKDILYCIFFPYSPEKLVASLEQQVAFENGSTVIGDPYEKLQMAVSVVGLGAPYAFGVVKITFVGGFLVLETAMELSSPRKNRTLVKVVGNIGGIQVSWSKRTAIEVIRTSSEKFGAGGTAVYEVKLLEGKVSFSDALIFTLPETGQREEIPVLYDAGHLNISDFSRQMIMVMVALAVLVGTLFIVRTRVHSLSSSSNPAAGVASSPVQHRENIVPTDHNTLLDTHTDGLQTPLHHRNLSRTPPQPYTDYVSRTLDHTPYYSRQNVRKFDPSRTY